MHVHAHVHVSHWMKRRRRKTPSSSCIHPRLSFRSLGASLRQILYIHMLAAMLFALALAWPLSNHTEIVAVTKPMFSVPEFLGWLVVTVGGLFAMAYALSSFPSSKIARLAYVLAGVIASALFTYHTDTELIEETTHDWVEHGLIACGIFTATKLLPTVLNAWFPRKSKSA